MWLLLAPALAAPVFEDITERVGLQTAGPSFAASFTDVDGDGTVDLFLTNHASAPQLWLQRDGQLVRKRWAPLGLDAHGGLVVDLDHDGRRDLFEAHGGKRGSGSVPNRAWIATDDGFEDRAAALGLDYGDASARMPLPLDADGDGWLDLYVVAGARTDGSGPSVLFFGGEDGWSSPVPLPEAKQTGATFVANTHGDARPEIHVFGNQGLRVLRATREGFVAADLVLPVLDRPADAVVPGDFDGDGRLDVLLLDKLRGADVEVRDGTLRLGNMGPLPKGLSARVRAATLTVELGPRHVWTPRRVRLGADCDTPEAVPMVLDAADVHGRCAGHEDAVRIGRDGDAWVVDWRAPKWDKLFVELRSPDLEVVGVEGLPVTRTQARRARETPRLLLGTDAGYRLAEDARGLPAVGGCDTGIAVDIDADGDLDLLLGCRSTAGNRANRLFRNHGGQFVEVTDHGAEGTAEGSVDGFATADLDGDGALELVALNGEGDPPWSLRGPVQVFSLLAPPSLRLRVVGGPHHRDAHGAVVDVVFADRMVRRHVGLVGWCGQSDDVLHVGTAGERVKWVDVTWPDGETKRFRGLRVGEVHALSR